MGRTIESVWRYFLGVLGLIAILATLVGTGVVLGHPIPIIASGLVLAGLITYLRFRGGWLGRPFIWCRDQLQHLGEYKALALLVKDLSEKNTTLENRVKEVEQALGPTYRAGLREGHAQFIGAWLSREVKVMPSISAVAVSGDRIQLTCRLNGDQKIEVRTRFSLVAVNGQSLGVLMVVSLAADGLTLTGDVIEETNGAFWKHIRENADHDFNAPQGVTIERYLVPPVSEEGPPAGQQSQQEASK